MVQKLGTQEALRDVDTKSLAPAYVKVMRSFGGRTRWLRELIFGISAVDGETPVIPKNPQGLYGIDHSGPPWGQAFHHPVVGRGGYKPNSADICGHRVVGTFDSQTPLTMLIRLWNRPFEGVRGAPYSRACLSFIAYTAAGTFSIDARASKPGRAYPRREASFSLTGGTTPTAYRSTDVYWDLDPGLNTLQLDFESATTTDATIVALSANIYEKLGH